MATSDEAGLPVEGGAWDKGGDTTEDEGAALVGAAIRGAEDPTDEGGGVAMMGVVTCGVEGGGVATV